MAPSRGKSLCVPFDKEEDDAACVAAPESFRPPLPEVCGQHPELCPASLAAGFVRHDQRWSRTPQRRRRRLERKATAGVCLVRPSFLLPSMGGRTEAVAKALSLRPWGVPCDAWVSGFGRNALDWSRAAMAWGRPAIVGRTGTQPEQLPAHVLADEKPTWALGPAVSVPTTVGGGGMLGATVTEAAAADALEAASGACAQEADALSPTSSPTTVGTDGWEGTQSAWRRRFPTVGILLCFRHSVVQSAKRGGRDRARRPLSLARVWAADNAGPRAQCSQRLRPGARVGQGAPAHRSTPADGPQTLQHRPPVRARVSLPGRPSHLQRARSAHAPSGPAPRREALSAWHARGRPSRRTCHGLAVELPPLRRSRSPRRPDAALSVPRPQRLRVPSQLAPQPAQRLLHGRSQTMNHEIR